MMDESIEEKMSEQESEEQKQELSEQESEDSIESEAAPQIKIDDKVLKQIMDRDEPELNELLKEFNESMDTVQNKLKPVLEKV